MKREDSIYTGRIQCSMREEGTYDGCDSNRLS